MLQLDTVAEYRTAVTKVRRNGQNWAEPVLTGNNWSGLHITGDETLMLPYK